MILDHNKDISMSLEPDELVEMAATVVPMVAPAMTFRYCTDKRVSVSFIRPDTKESICIDLTPSIAEELSQKILHEAYDWRDKAMAEHANDDETNSFLVMYRYAGGVTLVGRGRANQLLEFGVQGEDGCFALRLARSEPQNPEFCKFLHVTFPKYGDDLCNLARQISFVSGLMMED